MGVAWASSWRPGWRRPSDGSPNSSRNAAAGQTPLQRRLSTLGKRLAVAAFLVCIFVFVSGVARGEPADVMFLTAVSLAVAAIPEGLPAVVTIALALGARRMAQRHALVRKLPAVETLGSVTVICSDKTGTLTENRMLVERVWTPNGDYRVTGDGYAPTGRFDPQPANDTALERLAQVAAACNDASLHAPATSDDPWTISGDPTEAALLALAAKLEVDPDDGRRRMPAGRRADVRPRAATDGDHPHGRCGGLGRREGRPRGDRTAPRCDRGRPAAAGRARRRALRRRRIPRARVRRAHDRRRPRPARRRRARPPSSRDRRDGGPAARGLGPVDRGLPCGRHHADHDHRRSPADGQRDRPTDRRPARRRTQPDRRRARAARRRRLRCDRGRCGRVRADQPRTEAPHRGRLAAPWARSSR